MKDISALKDAIVKKLAQKNCNVSDISLCPHKDKCTCAVAAEIQAYIRSIIPEPYHRYSIADFDGRSANDTEEVLDQEIALEVKKKIVEYCWKGVTLDDVNNLSPYELDRFSIIEKRREDCINVAIYAKYVAYDLTQKVSFVPKGKTFCASIIMKEAIKNRLQPGLGITRTYDWIEYSILENMIKNKEETNLSVIRSSDWLVVDDIYYNKSFVKQLVDPFFLERLRDGLPTIFVFRFDAGKEANEEGMGIAMSKVIHDPKTCLISLSK
jgi:hypothetical protein